MLGMMGEVARSAIPRLKQLAANDKDKATAARAKAALASIERAVAKKDGRG